MLPDRFFDYTGKSIAGKIACICENMLIAMYYMQKAYWNWNESSCYSMSRSMMLLRISNHETKQFVKLVLHLCYFQEIWNYERNNELQQDFMRTWTKYISVGICDDFDKWHLLLKGLSIKYRSLPYLHSMSLSVLSINYNKILHSPTIQVNVNLKHHIYGRSLLDLPISITVLKYITHVRKLSCK